MEFATLLLNQEKVTRLTLTQPWDEKIQSFCDALKEDNVLEYLTLSGKVYMPWGFEGPLKILREQKNLSLKTLDLSGCRLKHKICLYYLDHFKKSLENEKNFTIIVSKDIFEPETLIEFQKSYFCGIRLAND